MNSPGARWLSAGFISLLLLARAPSTLAAGSKNDVIVHRNGDRVTCEIKELKLGQIRVKTEGMGTIVVEWDKVARITSPVRQEVLLSSGERYYGPLGPALEASHLVVLSPSGPVELELSQVVYLRPARRSFWNRFDGSLDLGGSYTAASSLLQLTPAFNTTYGGRDSSIGLDFDWTLTRQEGQDDTDRLNLSLGYNRFFGRRWVALSSVSEQRNTELGLALRSELSAGVGRFLVSTNRSVFIVGAGLAANRERPLEGETTSNLEALLQVRWRLFSYNFPKTDVSFSFLLYPSLSDWGRVRGDGDLSLKRELFRDFTVGLRVYDSFDNQPITEGAATNDWGATISLGWTF